jgi:hypothetical protein
MLRKVLPTGLVILTAAFAAACGSSGSSQPVSLNPQQDIVGSWSCQGMELTFSSDSTVSWVINYSGVVEKGSGDVGFVDNNHVIGVWDMSAQEYEVDIRGNEMELKPENGSTEKCSKK